MDDITKTQPNFMILTEGPVAAPAKCGVCGYTGADRLYSDLRQDFIEYGAFILCDLCIGALAQDHGYLEPARAQRLENRVKEVESELETLIDLRNTLEIVNGALSGFSFGRHEPDISDLVSNEPETDSIDSAESGELSPELPFGEGLGDSEADVDNSQPGPDDLLHLAKQLNSGLDAI